MLQRHTQLAFTGSIHFVTTVTRVRGDVFTGEKVCREVLELFEWYQNKYSVDCLGYVLMPDHLRALLHQEQAEVIIPPLMQSFKKLTSRRCCPAQYPPETLWHSRYDDVAVPGADAVRTKLEYMHANPVRRGLVEIVEDYPWSSARDYLSETAGLVHITKV
jgi:putative transposase